MEGRHIRIRQPVFRFHIDVPSRQIDAAGRVSGYRRRSQSEISDPQDAALQIEAAVKHREDGFSAAHGPLEQVRKIRRRIRVFHRFGDAAEIEAADAAVTDREPARTVECPHHFVFGAPSGFEIDVDVQLAADDVEGASFEQRCRHLGPVDCQG